MPFVSEHYLTEQYYDMTKIGFDLCKTMGYDAVNIFVPHEFFYGKCGDNIYVSPHKHDNKWRMRFIVNIDKIINDPQNFKDGNFIIAEKNNKIELYEYDENIDYSAQNNNCTTM